MVTTNGRGHEVAVIAGVGPGLGAALGRACAEAGMTVALAARRGREMERIAATLPGDGHLPLACDVTDEASVDALFETATARLGTPDLAIFNASGRVRGAIADLSLADYERALRVSAVGGFLFGRAAARAMEPQGRGTILFTGATASIKGFAGSAGFASGKFALRGIAQSMARELQPRGIHVAHVIVDGGIVGPRHTPDPERGPDHLLDPDAIAASYLALHRQHRSAWTQELDVRPWVERF